MVEEVPSSRFCPEDFIWDIHFYSPGGTNTSGALEHLRTRVFPAARREVAHVAIILTDGQSKNSTLTAEEAKKLREMGVYVFAVGIGAQTDVTELMDIASDPNENFVFHVDNFSSLRNIRELLAIKACDGKVQWDRILVIIF